jgi:hypothetical protein
VADLPWKEAIIKVMQDSETSMTRTEIAEAIVSQGLREKVGATPANTVVSNISTSMTNDGPETPFTRVGPGEYALKSVVDSSGVPEESESVADITGGINAFGVYWAKDLINWKTPKLLGQQQAGASTVDLSEQIGIYLLYDGREVVYVGRSIDRPIIQRLLEHTRDRLGARWDRLSWFGLYPVTDKGALKKETAPLASEELIQTLESVLIESMEPRQNRKRGNIFSSIEYIQIPDPKVKAVAKKAILDEMYQNI